jgi:HEAT repeat protein
VLRAAPRACLLLLLAPWASAAENVDDQDLSVSINELNTGDWSARMRTVHELEYLQDAAIPALAVAAVDGDWQVRMAAVHALAFLPKATPILKRVLWNEPCPVVRLITLHSLGSAVDDDAEERTLAWINGASSRQINDCRDQAAPGRAAWAAKIVRRTPEVPAGRVSASGPRPAPPAPEPAAAPEEFDDAPLTPDVPKKAAAPAPPESAAPTKSARYAELDALLSEPFGEKGALDGAPKLPPRKPDAKETFPRPAAAPPAAEHPVEGPAGYEPAGGKAPHDALPDLLLALKNGNVKTRSRAADELGFRGDAASAAVPALMAALRDASPRVRASAGLALGNIGAADAGVVPLLVKALKDKSADVRYAAALGLSRIDAPAARDAFKKRIGEDARRAIERPQP